jgi:hypothetical protein
LLGNDHKILVSNYTATVTTDRLVSMATIALQQSYSIFYVIHAVISRIRQLVTCGRIWRQIRIPPL